MLLNVVVKLVEIFSLQSIILLVIVVIRGSLHTHLFPAHYGLFRGSIPIIICHYLQQIAIVEGLFRRGFGNQNGHKHW